MEDIKNKISEFLSQGALYSRVEVDYDHAYPNGLYGMTYSYYCKMDSGIRTFRLETFPKDMPMDIPNLVSGIMEGKRKPISFTQHYKGICQHCKDLNVDILMST